MIASQSILTPPIVAHKERPGPPNLQSLRKGNDVGMAEALTSGLKTPMEKLGAKLFALEGYERRVLKAAYKFLGSDLGEANNFIGLPEAIQREWLDEFIEEHM